MKSDMAQALTWVLEIGTRFRECGVVSACSHDSKAYAFFSSATTGGDANSGHGSNGGVWEWTSTVFSGHDGLVPTDHFTG